jgi:hypothetical protein
MSTTIGQRERLTQNRIVKLFQTNLDYDYLDNQAVRTGIMAKVGIVS